jgi:RNA polymerase primary sigma factor
MSALRKRSVSSAREKARRSKTRDGRAVAARKRLTTSDARLVRVILDQPMDFMDSEAFHVPRARQLIFDQANPVRRADIGWYQPLMHDAAKAPPQKNVTKESIVLTRAEEATLFLQYNFARFKVAAIQERVGTRTPTVKQGEDLLHWYRVSRALRDQIAESNLALVLAMAKRVRINPGDFADQISEGNMALLRSVDKFDIGRGFKFSTYACRAILKAFYRQGMKDTKYRQRFPAHFDPAMESVDSSAARRRQSEQDGASEVKQLMLENTVDLSEVEQVVLQHRFGFEPGRRGRPMTLLQVGKLIGLTKERVRQIQNKALSKLREAVEQRRLPRLERGNHSESGFGFSAN